MSCNDTKPPEIYSLEALIARNNVEPIPPATIDAFRDHGKLAARLETGMEEAEEQLQQLEALGISLKDVTDKLLADGLVTFVTAYDKLLFVVDQKAKTLVGAGAQK